MINYYYEYNYIQFKSLYIYRIESEDQQDNSEIEKYNTDNLKTFEKEFMLCLCQSNLSEESVVKYVKLIEGSSNIQSDKRGADVQNNTSYMFSSVCLNSLFGICDSNNNNTGKCFSNFLK